MKKLFFYVAISLISLSLASCSDDGENGGNGNNTSVVTNETRPTDDGCTDGVLYYMITANEDTGDEACVMKCDSLAENVRIPDFIKLDGNTYKVTGIAEKAFIGMENMKSIVFSRNLTTIGEQALRGCKGLKSITLPASVTTLGDAPFCECPNLVSLSVEKDNNTFDSREGCNAIIETATNTLIAGCNTTVIPESVTCLGNNAFYHCDFESIKIPNSVTSIIGAFGNCEKMTNITIPESVTFIGDGAFFGCI